MPSLIFCSGDLVLHPAVFETLQGELDSTVEQYHAAHPMRRGMPQEELRRRLPKALKTAAFHRLLEQGSTIGNLETREGLVRLAGYDPSAVLSPVEREILWEIEGLFQEGGLKPPDLDSVLKRDRRRKNLYHFLVEAGTLMPVTERTTNRTIVFHQESVAEAERRLVDALANGAGLTVSELNAVLGTTRKFSIPLLEHLDAQGVTKRSGDLRYWKGRG